ncbi:MAG: transcription-repair coupling factor [Paludibacteraceae bacterium]|nr:transcription-repair coupling factor [Paludibacteraceae bacterium]
MQINELQQLFDMHPELDVLSQELSKKGNKHFLLNGLHASARALILHSLASRLRARQQGGVFLIVLDNADDAQYLYADLRALGNDNEVYYFPTPHRRRQGIDEAMAVQRTEVLSALLRSKEQGTKNQDKSVRTNQTVQTSPDTIIVTYPEAIADSVPNPKALEANKISLHVGEEIAISTLTNMLLELHFQRVDFVYEPGQFAVRGGIVDVYSYAHDIPFRIDFFGDEIDSIREFELETQLSQNKVDRIDIVSANSDNGNETLIIDYLPQNTLWISNDFSLVRYKYEGTITNQDTTLLTKAIDQSSTIEIGNKSVFNQYDTIHFDTLPQPTFNKNFDLLIDDLQQRTKDGYKIYILADQVKQTDRLKAIFDDKESGIQFVAVDHALHEGFIDHSAKICCYTDHQIFERYHRVTLRSENARRGKAIITLKEINQLQVGDYVVHVDHGIGQFMGLVTTNFHGRPQESIKLVYKGGDTVFVSIHNLHRISKYKGREGSEPTISRLGSGAWERMKERTKDKVKDIARDLIQLYATRKQQKGFAYTPDGYMQHELEASFLYEDTPDQAKATLDIKHDMESAMPMDRLVCGDVGFGKTEVAMRAAFKAATDGKQVAVLVPTTVLALQHYNTFKERFRDFPVRVEYLSRAKSAKQTKELLEDLKAGKIDILIGTHKLVGKQVVWKDLGLLIIDEEQKFGVAVKEKLKALRTNVDVLTLTATPIPRTLQFSLLGARDLSVINTPPPNRYPVQTEMITLDDEDIIKEAIQLEMQRNGQIYVVCNRIEMLPRIENRIHRLCPEARTVIAHGQMPPGEMEEALEAFINYDYDILISTTIIESGVDIANVNTIIIHAAQNYGLSDLHQLRGRVGRSNRKAYCYLVTPDRELLTSDARRRLDALTTFAELGAGFQLAMQDLDIRGAGNMLGSEQSGFIADLGYETYQRILNEAVEEIREEMLASSPDNSTLFSTTLNNTTLPKYWCNDCQLESDLTLGFPPTYIENIAERISLYRELDSLSDEDALLAYQKRLIDRFGKLPEEAEQLLNVVRLRWLCCKLGIEKVILKQERLSIYFTTKSDKYWQSEMFGKVVEFIFTRPQRCRMVEDKDRQGKPTGKRYATIQQVKTISGALNILSKMHGK